MAFKKKNYKLGYTKIEERVNVGTHLCGFILGLIGTLYLLYLSSFQDNLSHGFSYLIYGLSGMVLYLSSTLYHAVSHERTKRFLKICDHSAIYLFIAGCYTPFIIIHLANRTAYLLLGGVWVLAFLGVIFKLFFTGRFQVFSTVIYLVMGWIVMLLGRDLGYYLSTETILWLVAGGVSYSVGTFFYLSKNMPFHHGVWHLFVLCGSFLHYVAILSASNI